MLMKAIPIEAATGRSGQVNDRSAGKNSGADSGFSDVLGNVGGDGRKQPGLAGSSGSSVNKGSNAGKSDFAYTQKASESVRVSNYGDPSQGQRVITADNGQVFDESTADKLLAEAAGMVTRTVQETGKSPARAEAAEMLTDALTDIKAAVKTDSSEAPEKAADSSDPTALIDALIGAVTAVSDGSAQTAENADDVQPEDDTGTKVQSAGAKAVKMPVKAMPVRAEAPKEANTDTVDFDVKLMQLAEPDEQLTEYAGEKQPDNPEDAELAAQTVLDDAAKTVKLFPDDAQKTAKSVPDEVAETTKSVPDEVPETAKNVMPDKADERVPDNSQERADAPKNEDITLNIPRYEDVAAKDVPKEMPFELPKYEDVEAAKNAAEKQQVPDFNEARDLPRGYNVVREVFASPERGLQVSAVPELPQPEENTAVPEAVNDTLKLLGELITDAKKELGLSEVRFEYTKGDEPETAVPIMPNEHIKLSRQMNGRDRSGELDHILNEGREDVSGKQSGKTETYDAVRMSENLSGSRTDTRLTSGEQVEFRDEAEKIARPPEVQVTERILSRLEEMQARQQERTEFTMVLNPESLGRITVKLIMTGEKTAVEINAENPDTRALLASRSEALQNMLKDNGVQLERYQVVSEQEDAAFERQSYDGSSRNPYHRNDTQQQEDDDDSGNSFYDLLQSI